MKTIIIKMKDVEFECELSSFFDSEYEYEEYLVHFEWHTIGSWRTEEEAIEDAHSYFYQLWYDYVS